MDIKVTGKIEKTVEINPLDVIKELKLQWFGNNEYFIGNDNKVYWKTYVHTWDDAYREFLAPIYIQQKKDLLKALKIIEGELS